MLVILLITTATYSWFRYQTTRQIYSQLVLQDRAGIRSIFTDGLYLFILDGFTLAESTEKQAYIQTGQIPLIMACRQTVLNQNRAYLNRIVVLKKPYQHLDDRSYQVCGWPDNCHAGRLNEYPDAAELLSGTGIPKNRGKRLSAPI
jgi:hypothetical protein